MNGEDLKQELSRALAEQGLKAELLPGEPMSAHTTFQTGGPAALFVRADADAGSLLYRYCMEQDIPVFLLGRGSNVLVSDAGYEGVVLSLTAEGEEKNPADATVLSVSAGLSMSAAAHLALERGLSGMEFAAGIPGTVGGGVVMNAGAYGGEMKDILTEIEVMTPEGRRSVSASELSLSYRYSKVPENRWFVLSAVFRLTRGDKDEIKAKMEELASRRREKQPLNFPSAGSTFKRPEGYFAGKLIEDAGLKGFSIGDAQVSEKHAGFIINRGNATSAEIKRLIDEVIRRVYEHSGVRLSPEVRFLGDFS